MSEIYQMALIKNDQVQWKKGGSFRKWTIARKN